MSIERVFHCDGPDCDRNVLTTGTRPPVFITVREDAGRPMHFCGWDCLLRLAATKPPSETIPLSD